MLDALKLIMPLNLKARFSENFSKGIAWTRRHVPPGLRIPLGLVLIVGGVFGFLPVLGFWMIPLGVAIILLDLKTLSRFARALWRNRKK